jgi:alpha-glucosidase
MDAVRAEEAHGTTLTVDLGGPRLSIAAIAPSIVRVRYSSTGAWRPRRSWATTQLPVPPPDTTIRLETDPLAVVTDDLRAGYDEDGRFSVVTTDGRELVSDASDRGGVHAGDDGNECSWALRMPAGRRYLGFGERTGPLDKRGRRYTCWTTDEWRHQGPQTDSLYLAIPFHIGVDEDGRAFGLFLDSTFRSTFDLTDIGSERMVIGAEDRELDWYVIDGPSLGDVVTRFTALVGRAELPPRWALGFHQARWSYGLDDEVRTIAERFRRERVPADAIHLDIDHMDGYRVFSWEADHFPDPPGMIGHLRNLGFRTTVVIDAGVKQDPDDETYRSGHEGGHFVRTSDAPDAPELTGYVWPGLCVLPDHARAATRDWWGRRYGGYLDAGVAGFLNDMNEPALHDRPVSAPGSRNTEPPPDTPMGDGDERTTHAEIRNVYASLENRATVEALRTIRPAERPFLVTRSGFAGVQRHAIVWTGDNASTWEHLEMSLPQLLNLGLSGVPLAGADIGGFFEQCTPELLVRWTQLGAVYPFARNNSAAGTARQEVWAWGEPTLARCRRAIELRYRLLPYLYTVVEEATRTGWPVFRPLLFHHPIDPAGGLLDDQALVGRDVLVAPVLHPGKTARDAWLPAGGWVDLRTGTWVDGGTTVLVSAGLDEELPIFLRAGAIVPMGPVMQWTDERPTDPLTLHVLLGPDGTATGRLYEDDGASTAYRNGRSSVTTFDAGRDPASGDVTVVARRRGSYDVPRRRVEVVLHGSEGASTSTAHDPGDPGEWLVKVRPR